MPASHRRVLLGLRASRFMRGSLTKAKKRLRKGNEGTPSSIIGDTILPPKKANREKKYKSTLAVAIAGTAIGISHVAAVSGKYHKTVSGPSTLAIGLAVGITASTVWYNHIDAAYDGVSEEDISMMFEMANSTGYGSMDDSDDSAKAVDILHTIVTGKTDNTDSDTESMFKYEDEEDEEDDIDADCSMFGKKVSFAEPESTKVKPTARTGFGNVGIGKPLSRSNGFARKSNLPDLDRQEAESERSEEPDGWMELL